MYHAPSGMVHPLSFIPVQKPFKKMGVLHPIHSLPFTLYVQRPSERTTITPHVVRPRKSAEYSWRKSAFIGQESVADLTYLPNYPQALEANLKAYSLLSDSDKKEMEKVLNK